MNNKIWIDSIKLKLISIQFIDMCNMCFLTIIFADGCLSYFGLGTK